LNQNDKYLSIAETYDYMLIKIPREKSFFAKIFQQYNVKSVLDCACGTGKDLVLFNSLGFDVAGSDFSDSMLSIAQKRIKENGLKIPRNFYGSWDLTPYNKQTSKRLIGVAKKN
jgi:glycine/sarcosine N-methyltransferase